MGEVCTDKANEFFRKELTVLSTGGKKLSVEFADCIINIARTNDLIGAEGILDITDENDIETVKKRTNRDTTLQKQREYSDKLIMHSKLGDSLYKDFADVPAYHFDFEDYLSGEDLQLAYVNKAISIIKCIGVDERYKIASYYSYIFEILWLDSNINYLPLLDEAFEYFVALKTEKCPENINILKQKVRILREEFYAHNQTDFILFDNLVTYQFLNNLHNQLLLNCKHIYGEYSIQHIEALEEYADFYDAIEDFEKELECYNYIYTIYDRLGMHNEAVETKRYCRYLAKRNK